MYMWCTLDAENTAAAGRLPQCYITSISKFQMLTQNTLLTHMLPNKYLQNASCLLNLYCLQGIVLREAPQQLSCHRAELHALICA